MEIEQFKIRASAAGLLLTNPKKKEDILSQTTKTFIKMWVKERIFGMRKELDTKEINKGKEYEDMAIDCAIDWLDLPFAIKNEKKFEDELFTGEPDLILEDRVIDIKNSWDWATLPLFEDEIPTDGYIAQVQVYMHLTGLKKASVVYMLMTTPARYKNEEINYDHIDKKYRYKRFDFEYDPEMIKKLQERVILAREYINSIIY